MKQTALSFEIQKELSDLLQDVLVAQPKLAHILDPDATMGKLSSEGNNALAGGLLNAVSHNAEEKQLHQGVKRLGCVFIVYVMLVLYFLENTVYIL